MKLEKMQQENMMSCNGSKAPATSNVCSGCARVENTYDINEEVEQLARVADQAATAISDTLDNGVNHCPPSSNGRFKTP